MLFFLNQFAYNYHLQPNKTVDTVAESNGEAITHLTAEIESFVRTADTDKESINVRVAKIKEDTIAINECKDEIPEKDNSLRQSPESNEYYPHDQTTEITIEKIQNLGEIDANSNERCKKSPVKILIRAPTEEEPTIDKDIKVECRDSNVGFIVGEAACAEKCPENNSVGFEEDISKISEIENIENAEQPIEMEVIFENDLEQNDSELIGTCELKITESVDDLNKIESQQVTQVDDTREIIDNKNELKLVPIASSQKTRATVSDVFDARWDTPGIKKEFDNKKRKPPTPPQRRRSVKEIIESINRCQKLLKINHELNTNKCERDENNDLFQPSSSNFHNMNDIVGKEYKNKQMFADATEVNNNAKIEDMSNIPLFVEKFNELNRSTSNVEWNPLPKPRRHRSSIQGSGLLK